MGIDSGLSHVQKIEILPPSFEGPSPCLRIWMILNEAWNKKWKERKENKRRKERNQTAKEILETNLTSTWTELICTLKNCRLIFCENQQRLQKSNKTNERRMSKYEKTVGSLTGKLIKVELCTRIEWQVAKICNPLKCCIIWQTFWQIFIDQFSMQYLWMLFLWYADYQHLYLLMIENKANNNEKSASENRVGCLLSFVNYWKFIDWKKGVSGIRAIFNEDWF